MTTQGCQSGISGACDPGRLNQKHSRTLGIPLIVARHGKLPPRRHEELPPQWIAEERANERTTNHGKPVVE
ncbi:MAG: hypothetical protein E5X09_15805 [Mesorhizobium sp.]|nr:MAG: hypothetical protein E5X09_15805 [Mesorhizobium sp.]